MLKFGGWSCRTQVCVCEMTFFVCFNKKRSCWIEVVLCLRKRKHPNTPHIDCVLCVSFLFTVMVVFYRNASYDDDDRHTRVCEWCRHRTMLDRTVPAPLWIARAHKPTLVRGERVCVTSKNI